MVQTTKITENFIKDRSIGTNKLADDSVIEQKLATDSISTAKIQDSAVSSSALLDDSVTSAKIAGGAVDTPQIEDSSITPAKLTDTGFPIGGIVIWSGTIGAIPAGFSICNGTNGTPDMRGKFVVGAGSTYTNLSTGGNDTQTTSSNGSHTHTGSVSSAGSHDHGGYSGYHALTGAQVASHRHVWMAGVNTSSSIGGATQSVAVQRVNGAYPDEYGIATSGANEPNIGRSSAPKNIWSGATTTDQSHRHAINTSGSHVHGVTLVASSNHTHTMDARPKFYALAYIMRTS